MTHGMQPPKIGRNASCPCGSGRKFKKCCLGAVDDAAVRTPGEIDVNGLIERVVLKGEWELLDGYLSRAIAAFSQGGPLEYLRFPKDLTVPGTEYSDAMVRRLCTPIWLAECEDGIMRLLTEYTLERHTRDSFRLTLALIRKLGAEAPVFVRLAKLQAAEQFCRGDRLASALGRLVATDEERVDIAEWIKTTRPAILTFADWITLWNVRDGWPVLCDYIKALWNAGLSARICEVCLKHLAGPSADHSAWAVLATMTMIDPMPQVACLLAQHAPLRNPTPDEQSAYDMISQERMPNDIDDIVANIALTSERNGDYISAGVIRRYLRVGL